MTLLEKICYKVTYTIASKLNLVSNDKLEIINYGLYIFVADTLKIIIIISIAWFLGTLLYTLLAIVCQGILRSFTGGVHAKSWLGCLISNTLINFSVVFISIFLSTFNVPYLFVVTFIISLFIIHRYSPADHENKPVISKKQIKTLRILSHLIFILQYCLALIFYQTTISNIFVLSTFVVTISMLPITYKITRNKHGNVTFSAIPN